MPHAVRHQGSGMIPGISTRKKNRSLQLAPTLLATACLVFDFHGSVLLSSQSQMHLLNDRIHLASEQQQQQQQHPRLCMT